MPDLVERWVARVRLLRWLDALAAWAIAFLVLAEGPPDLRWGPATVAASLIVGPLAVVGPLRRRWRVVSGAVGLWVSRSLAAGDLAWCVGPGSAERVIVTARRGARLTVARPGGDAAEGMSVRRTRMFVVPFEGAR
jgi:peptidoglycan/LPS O-acetylase OafA/YrhL